MAAYQTTNRERAILLAALRYFQRFCLCPEEMPDDVANIIAEAGEPLKLSEIDDLCEALNFDASAGDRAHDLLVEFDKQFGRQVAEDIPINACDAVDWISEFSPRVRDVISCHKEDVQVMVCIEGGMVSAVLADRANVNVLLIDYDVEGDASEDTVHIPQDDGTTAEAYSRSELAEVRPDFIAAAAAVVSA